MIWAIVATLAIVALFAFGRTMYRAGAARERLKQKEAQERGREYVQKVVDRNAALSDAELDEWLRGRQNHKG